MIFKKTKKYFFLFLFFLLFASNSLALGPGDRCIDDDECDNPLMCSNNDCGAGQVCCPPSCSSSDPCPTDGTFRASDGTSYPRYCIESESRCSRNGDPPPETMPPPPGPSSPSPSGATRCVGSDSACTGATEICIIQPSVTGCGTEPNRCCLSVPCTSDSECPDGRSCSSGWCQKGWATDVITPGSVMYDGRCYTTSDCFGGLACIANKCKYCNESGSDQSSWDNNCYPKTGGCQIEPSEPSAGRCGGQPISGPSPAPASPTAQPTTPYSYSVTPPTLSISLPTLGGFTELVSTGDPGDRYLLIPWLGEYIAAIYKYAIGITGVLAGIMIVVAGLIWLTAGGSAERVSAAKNYIEGALVGLVIALASYVLLYAINPKLTEFDAMKVRFIERIETGGTAESSGTQDTCPQVTPLDCNDPNTIITWEKFNNVDLSLFTDKVKSYVTGSSGINRSLIPKYKSAAAGKIPWEMLAVLHRREGGGEAASSVLNGSELCNNNDNSSCAACGCPGPECGKESNPKATRENDLTCGVELILKKAGRVGGTLQHNEADFETIKKAFGRYAGSASGCYDATYHTTALFDQHHSNMWKSGIDCISMQGNCDETCVTDATLSPRNPRGCCTIKVYKRGKAPAGFNPRGSFCNNIQRPSCKIAEDETTATYKYKACTTISEDPCGALQPQDRPGALTIYAWLKKAQQTDTSLR